MTLLISQPFATSTAGFRLRDVIETTADNVWGMSNIRSSNVLVSVHLLVDETLKYLLLSSMEQGRIYNPLSCRGDRFIAMAIYDGGCFHLDESTSSIRAGCYILVVDSLPLGSQPGLGSGGRSVGWL